MLDIRIIINHDNLHNIIKLYFKKNKISYTISYLDEVASFIYSKLVSSNKKVSTSIITDLLDCLDRTAL